MWARVDHFGLSDTGVLNVQWGVYNINVQTGPSLGVMHLHVIALTLTPASSYINIVHPHCTLTSSDTGNCINFSKYH
jgi:hypothetical protein